MFFSKKETWDQYDVMYTGDRLTGALTVVRTTEITRKFKETC